MFLLLSKWLDLLVDPVACALLLALLALAIRRRAPRAAAGLAAVAVLGLWALSTEAVSDAIGRATEAGAKDTSRAGVYDAVVILGGGIDPPGTIATGRLELNDGADRLVRGFELLRAGRARLAILSGGSIDPDPSAPREAEHAARMLASWGVEPARLVVEPRARNTRENAVEVARIVRERGLSSLLLVTSAAHVPRAVGCFRAVGLAPDVLPVDFRAGRGPLAARRLVPRAHSLAASADAIRELFGRVVYRAVGYAR